MADIFISYAREDREWVEQLAKAFTNEGYTVWWDWDLLVGKRYRETIENELQTCKATVVVWSQHSIRSDFVRDEAEEGQGRNILVPLLKENVRPPAGFRQLQTADLTQWNGAADNVEFRRMLRGLQHVIGDAAAAEKYDEPEPPQPAATATVAPAATIAEAVITPTPVTPEQKPVAPAAKPVVAPEPTVQAKAPEPVVQTKTPIPAPSANTGTSPPPPAAKAMGTPPGSTAALAPLANLKVPPSSHPVWRYVAIGGVVFLGLIYIAAEFWPEPKPPKPIPVVHTTPANNNNNGTQPLPADNGDTANEHRHGAHANNSATPAPVNNTSTVGTAPTNMTGVPSDVADVLTKAETADRDARVQAAAGSAAQKAALAGTTTDSNSMTLGSATLAEGAYSGQLYNGTAQGVGALSYKNGDLYAGQFDEGRVSGRGVVTFANKSSGYGYSGQFAAGAYNGLGVYYLSNGWRFEGTFKNNQLNGLGAKVDPSGKVVEQGTYDNGTLK